MASWPNGGGSEPDMGRVRVDRIHQTRVYLFTDGLVLTQLILFIVCLYFI